MDNSASYNNDLLAFKTKAQTIEQKYLQTNDSCSHDKSAEDLINEIPREQEYALFGSKCPRCSSEEIESNQFVQGCRMNGDGYGSYSKLCMKCGCFGLRYYDEA